MAGSDSVELRIKLTDEYFFDVDVQELEYDIHKEGKYAFLRIYSDGQLLVSDENGVIVGYQAMLPDTPKSPLIKYWGDLPGGYEWAGPVPHNINPKTVKGGGIDGRKRRFNATR
jgi:hypothetical protein